MYFTRLAGLRKEEIARWAKRHVAASSLVVSDGLNCFTGVEQAECQHEAIVTGGRPGSVTMQAYTWINTMIGNMNTPPAQAGGFKIRLKPDLSAMRPIAPSPAGRGLG